jgi:hypothetical protein
MALHRGIVEPLLGQVEAVRALTTAAARRLFS